MCTRSVTWLSRTLLLLVACFACPASARMILYSTQANTPGPGGVYPDNVAIDSSWANDVCSGNNGEFPQGSETEWTPILDPISHGDAEVHLTAVSGTVVYNPQPDESGFCQSAACPGQPIPCTSDGDCNATACGGTAGTCDLAQGPSCVGGTCPSPWSDPQVGAPIACVNDGVCAASACGGGRCAALGRSRGDVPSTHPFGFDFDVAIAPDAPYLSLLAPGNVAAAHLDLAHDPTGQTAFGGFEDVVYPFLHATTPATTPGEGWCTPDFDTRCFTSADCPPGGACEGNVNGLGLDASQLPGTLGMETDHDLLPESYVPHDGDRTAVFGRWIVDCGHGNKTIDSTFVPGWHTEIHPPLLIANARSTGPGAFDANCSDEQTCSSVIGRPFLVSQHFGDGFFLKHLAHEAEKLGCLEVTGPAFSAVLHSYAGLPDCALGLDPTCVCDDDAGCIACEATSCGALDTCVGVCPFFPPACSACLVSSPPLGLTCTTQLEERPRFTTKPFAGVQDMQYYVQPANGRLNAGDRMLAEWHLTARHGVTVALSDGGDDVGVLVDVTLDESQYPPATLPSKQDWPWTDSRLDPLNVILGTIALVIPTETPQALVVGNGIFSDRYRALAVPPNETSPTVGFADQLDGTMQAAQVIDDSQPFPVAGHINVGWFRCDAGGPYVLDCAGPRTSVTLDGSGSSDPDGRALTYTWTGAFGTATGVAPTVRFDGGGTFPVTLTVSNGQVSTSCDATVTIHPAALFQLGGPGNAAVTGPAGGIDGDACIGPNGDLNVTGAQFVTGAIHLAGGATLNKSGSGTIGPVLRNQDLSARIADTLAAATDFAATPCTQTFAKWNTSTTITGTGGANVVCVGDVTLHGGDTVTLKGGAHDRFLVNVTGRFEMSNQTHIVASGVPPDAVLIDVVGTGRQVQVSGAGGGPACCNTTVDGGLLAVGRTIAIGSGLVNGPVIGGQDVRAIGGSSVR